MAWGGSKTARECSSAERGGRTARWPSGLCFGEFNVFRSLKNWTMSLPRPFPLSHMESVPSTRGNRYGLHCRLELLLFNSTVKNTAPAVAT